MVHSTVSSRSGLGTSRTEAAALSPLVAGNDEEPVLDAVGVGALLGGQRILRDVNLSVQPRETVAIIGPSGSGKTTLLRCLNFLVPYDCGRVYLRGELIGYREVDGKLIRRKESETTRQRSRFGFVFQRFNLFPHRTVLGNLLEGPVYVLKLNKAQARERAISALERVGLQNLAERYPAELSGGQQQRVAIARALCMDPEVMLLDEITSALDPELVAEVTAVMRQLSDDGVTMVVVTHELRFAQRSADRIVFMDSGTIVADMPTESFFANPPSDRISAYLAQFRGEG
jgi:polar amino acid transport system ATP-binding protein